MTTEESNENSSLLKTVHLSDNEIVLLVTGSMTGDRVHVFERSIRILCKSTYTTITIDLSHVDEISSLFVGHILECQKQLTPEKRKIRIQGCRDSVAEVLFLMHIDKTIDIERQIDL
jgi:anti-anti-sigma regulatory factor